jgi:uncharacterized protein (TIGR03118 family)
MFLQHNLVSDLPGIADHTDPNLVNPWGIAFSTTGPFWLSDNTTGLSTVYNSSGVASSTVVSIPVAGTRSSAKGTPTGIVWNGTTGFTVAAGKPASFIFATEDGTISAWASSVNPTNALVQVDNSGSGAVYKGLALAASGSASFLYAANFHSGAIDVFDSNFKPVTNPGAFTDPYIPSGFAPFNVVALGGKLYVSYAKQDSAGKNDVAGAGNGYVDVYTPSGTLLQSLIAGGNLNSPWGMAIASANFGDFSNDLLVGNFGDGKINVYDPVAGKLLGTLQDTTGNPLQITGLWDLQLGNGGNGGDANAVYFTAEISAPTGGTHGLFGSIQASPSVLSAANDGSFLTGFAPNTWVAIFGANLAATTRSWLASDFVGNKLPTSLDGVSVTIDGKPAYVGYVSPKQINVLVPADSTTGSVQIVSASNRLTSTVSTTQMATVSPAFFIFKGTAIAASHADGSPVGATTLYPNSSTPAQPGETIVLWGTGFGATNPAYPDGQLLTAAAPLATPPTVTIGGVTAQVLFAGLTAPGLYQFNVTVPASTPSGDNAISVQVNGVSTQAGTTITVQQ